MTQLNVLPAPAAAEGQLLESLIGGGMETGPLLQLAIAIASALASQAAVSLEKARLCGDLGEPEARIRHLMDASVIGIFVCDLEGGVYEANDAFLSMVGYDREDLAAGHLRWTDMTPSEWKHCDERPSRS